MFFGSTIIDDGCFGEMFSLSLIARRCRKCEKWGTYLVEGKIDETYIRKAVVRNDKKNCTVECFVDDKLNPIDNPLSEKSKLELEQSTKDLEDKQDKEKRSKLAYVVKKRNAKEV